MTGRPVAVVSSDAACTVAVLDQHASVALNAVLSRARDQGWLPPTLRPLLRNTFTDPDYALPGLSDPGATMNPS